MKYFTAKVVGLYDELNGLHYTFKVDGTSLWAINWNKLKS
jgi:hypothetical protein